MKVKVNNFKKTAYFLFILLLIFVSVRVVMAKNLSNNINDLFDQIINKCDANIVQYGISVSFENCGDAKEVCEKIFNDLNLNVIPELAVDSDSYCIEFNNNTIKGYIKSSKNNEGNIILINIIKKDKLNELNKLKQNVENSISMTKHKKNYKCFMFLKAKLPNNNIKLINKNILDVLKSNDISKIQTIEIENGYSTMAYTGKYDMCKVGSDFFDFNYAIHKYDSGSYLIIGIPQIIIDY